MSTERKVKVLLEMRPAMEGFAGIPQETRLLFRGLRMIDSVETEGMIQMSHRSLAKGTPLKASKARRMSDARRLNRYSRVIVSMAEKPYRTVVDIVIGHLERRLAATSLSLRSLIGASRVKLTRFESENFTDFTWRTLFSKTLPASDFSLVATANHRICSVPWRLMHMAGLRSLSAKSTPSYPRLATEGVDVFIAQTPYPATVSRNTAFVVRYHDAIPVFMPHTIPEKSVHQATHFYALGSNVRCGAWFACVSEATRQDLLRLFPEAAPRAVTIHNMVSHHYFDQPAAPERVPEIIRARLYEGVELLPKFFSLREQENFYKRVLSPRPFKYVMIVSTIEPRKNHARLLAAWEVLKSEIDPDLKLVVVGTLGWDNAAITKAMRPWIDRGELFPLNAVPAPDLRVLYRNALATVCPSLGEGFDFSGVESMRSGGVTVASDIPVHREIYDDASGYFDPYSTASLVKALKEVIYDEGAETRRKQLRLRGAEVSGRYLPEAILPQWQSFLSRVTGTELGTTTQADVVAFVSKTQKAA
ncbi:group 1 glycosyl transferase [Pandoraea captiosa]|uniref:Group 1 glycosyl transferase n=1 Tax=Pandoraea captiosa TaxID=2508302 RepID=A0A5E5AN49_9BURK|nr:glycosyltransferase family 1 protein [Pandoraea captiosa]VVE73510.1 group 1 glycosyl transferase [Pandoraea captiosa]